MSQSPLVSAQDTKVSVDMIGIGRMSCAHWRSTQAHRLEGTIWIYGFWTGLNYVAAASDQAVYAPISMTELKVSVIVEAPGSSVSRRPEQDTALRVTPCDQAERRRHRFCGRTSATSPTRSVTPPDKAVHREREEQWRLTRPRSSDA